MSLKKLRFESFLLSPQEKLPAFVSEWENVGMWIVLELLMQL